MHKNNITVIIMAAGEGTRMHSKLPKTLHAVCGRAIIDYVVNAAQMITDTAPIVVVGHGGDALMDHLGDKVRYARQEVRLGTGHAVMMAKPFIRDDDGYVVILAGDTPLITGETLNKMVENLLDGGFSAVALSAIVKDSYGYGRILREPDQTFKGIVEHKDASEAERAVREINASMYCFRAKDLLVGLKNLSKHNAQGEYYLTDVLGALKAQGKQVGISVMEDADEMMGVNTRVQLAEAQQMMRRRINRGHMISGVTLLDPDNTYIGPDVVIGVDTLIYPGNHIEGKTIIEEDCVLYPGNRIVDAKLEQGVEVQSSVIQKSRIGKFSTVGPYAYIRPGSDIGEKVKIGDFVEVKNSVLGSGTKVSHLTYIGDADLGANINVGCGVVCVNYDGESKHRTTIGDQAFIGCNVNLVAPVTVESEAYVAAGSTITDTVPAKALAIARARQVNKEGWVDSRSKKKK